MKALVITGATLLLTDKEFEQVNLTQLDEWGRNSKSYEKTNALIDYLTVKCKEEGRYAEESFVYNWNHKQSKQTVCAESIERIRL